MADDTLCFSDVVCLYSTTTDGLVFSSQSSSVYNDVVVGSSKDEQSPNIGDPKQFLFEICVANQYKANKVLHKLKVKADDDQNSPQHNMLQNAGTEAKTETRDNELKQKVHQGKKLIYGQIIQLKHTFTQKFLHVNIGCSSTLESSRNNLAVLLQNFNAKNAQFKVLPSINSKTEGVVVEAGEQVVFESLKWPGHYLHVSKSKFDRSTSVYKNCHELNLSQEQSGFKVTRTNKPATDDHNSIKAGDIVRLLHKGMEGYMVAEGLFDHFLTEDVHLRLSPEGRYNSRHRIPSSSAITYWKIILQEDPMGEGTLQWHKKCKLLHLCTRQYLCVTQDGKAGLTIDPNDDKTLFRFHQVSMDHDDVQHETSCRIEHVASRKWLHGSTDRYKSSSKKTADEGNGSPVGSLKWSNAQLRKIQLVKEQHKEDVFTVQHVDSELENTFYFISGMIPFLDKLLKYKKDGVTLNSNQSIKMCTALKEIKEFMLENDGPIKKRQKLLRNLHIVDIFMKILNCPYNVSDAHHMTLVMEEIYDVLHTYLRGRSIKNKLFIARHIDFIMMQCNVEEGSISKKAVTVITEAIRNNRTIVDTFTRDDVDKVVGMLLKGMNYRHLDLLNALCVCTGEYIADNQTLIAGVWLGDTQNYVYLTKLENGMNYVSTNRGRDWIDFITFANRGDEDDEYKFLLRQLNLFCDISRGQPDMIDMVTELSKYFTWQEAFNCLKETKLPKKLRTMTCRLILTMFVDIVDNINVVDHVSHCYVYDKITRCESIERPVDTSMSKTDPYFKQLNEWIVAFLNENKEMVYSEIENNVLITEVLCLVKYLVKYGFYWETGINNLLSILLEMLKGHTDKPSPNVEAEDLIQFRNVERFKASKEAEAVVGAKIQVLEILHLFLKRRPRGRVEEFLWHFKTARHTHGEMNLSKFKVALQKNDQVTGISVALDQNNLLEVLQDLMRYQSDVMIQKSMHVLNEWFSAEEKAFSGCLRAQILQHEDSVKMYNQVQEVLLKLRLRLARPSMKNETKALAELIDELTRCCCLEDDKNEPHEINQSILCNCGVLEDAISILATSVGTDDNPYLQNMLKKTFKLLKGLAKDNPMVQRQLFDQIDLLLGKTGCVVEMTELLVEIFARNTYTKLKVTQQHIQKVVEIGTLHKPGPHHLLDVLLAIVQVEDFDVPIRKNQNMITNCLMQRDTELTQILFTDSEMRMQTLLSKNVKDVNIFLSLVELLARCAEGENRFSQKICRTILRVPEILNILINDNISVECKTPFVLFLNNVYLQTVKGQVENVVEGLQQDPKMWTYIETVSSTFETLTGYCPKHKKYTKRALNKHSSISGSINEEKVLIKFSIQYLFDAVFPLLQNFSSLCRTMDPNESARINSVLAKFKGFLDVILSLVTIETQRSSLIVCLKALSKLAGDQEKDTIDYLRQLKPKVLYPNYKSKARMKYEERYRTEIEINKRLQELMTDLKSSHVDKADGENFGLPIGKTYSDISCEREAPLGDEFMKLVNVFIDDEATSLEIKYRMADNIVRQLSLTSKCTSLVGSERVEQRALDIKCMQLLREMVYMEVEETQSDIGQAQVIENIQNTLNSFGKMFGAIDHLARPDDVFINEILALLLTFLFNGNTRVQKVLYDCLEGTRKETFIQFMYRTLYSSAEYLSDRRNLRSSYFAKVDELNTLEDTLKQKMDNDWAAVAIAPMRKLLMKSINSSKMSLAILQKATQLTGKGFTSQADKHPVERMNVVLPKNEDEFSIEKLRLATEDLSCMSGGARAELVLGTLGAICGLQNTEFQDMLREQPNSGNSVNLIAVTAKCSEVLVDDIDSNSIELLIQVFDTLTRFSTGNQKNQKVIFNYKVCDHVLQVLRLRDFKDCSDLQVYSLKRTIGVFLGRLVEEHSGDHMERSISEDVMGCIDAEILVSTMTDAYTENKVKKANVKKIKTEVMFRFYHLLARKCDVDHNIKMEAVLKTAADQDAFYCCADHTHSVELLKDNTIQKLYFTVTEKNVLREDVKEKFENAVDRTSPSTKIHDFMDWTRDITQDARRKRRIGMYILGRFILWFILRSWTFLNYAVYLLSLAIAVLLAVTWVERESDNDVRPDFKFRDSRDVFYVFAGTHIFLSVLVFVGYCLIYRPTFPHIADMKAIIRKSRRTDSTDKGRVVSDEKRHSHLEVKIYGIRTIYYFLFLAFSVAGIFTSGYFFAFHLLHITELYRPLRRVLQAVTMNGYKLLSVAILGIAVFYMFSLILFAFYRDPTWLDGRYCRNIYECFVSVVHHGFVGGPYMLNSTGIDISFGQEIGIMFFDLSFFLLVTILGLYIILAVIVDGFMQLRKAKAQSFQRHITEEHNLWSYMHFFIHLDKTRPRDYSALENYVYKMLLSENYSFLPIGRAICLESYDRLKGGKSDDVQGLVVSSEKEADSKKHKHSKHKKHHGTDGAHIRHKHVLNESQ